MSKTMRFILNSSAVALVVFVGYLLYAWLRQSAVIGVIDAFPISYLLRIVFVIYLIGIALFIVMDNRSPNKIISWLLLMIAFPLVGFFAYLAFGRSFRKERLAKLKRKYMSKQLGQLSDRQRDHIVASNLFADSMVTRKIVNLLLNNAHAPYVSNNQLTIYDDGKAMFNALLRDISQAKQHIHLEYYIVRHDQTGQRLKAALQERARAGVEVRLIYDSVGSWRLSVDYLRDLERAGVVCKPFLPVIVPFLSRELNYRNHRKITVIDGRIGYIGGMNIGDEYLGLDKHMGYWRDTHARIDGQSVAALQRYFLVDWNFVSGRELPFDRYVKTVESDERTTIQIAASGPDTDWEIMLQAYFVIITNARKRVWITTPYLVPDDSLLEALKTAALSGVDVRILLPAKADHFMVYWATRANFKTLLAAGVKLYLYQNGFIHAKTIVVDDDVVTIGTANFDIRSLEINFEINCFIYEQTVVDQMARIFERDLSYADVLTAADYANTPRYHRVLEAVGRLVSPLQ